MQRAEVGGRDVTLQLLWHLRKSGHGFHTSAEVEAVRVMKEAACYVARDPAAEEAAVREGSGGTAPYLLPDGTKLALGAERFRAAEVLFQPRLAGLEYAGVGTAVGAAVLHADLALRAPLLANVLLAGGSTALRGFGERLLADARAGAAAESRIKIFAPADRKMLAWVGGSILASLSTFRTLAIKKAAWEEEGARLLHRAPAM